jgi:hypothetical protein
MEVFFGVILFLLVYLIPSFVSNSRKHKSHMAIVLLNLFLGWTFLGWLGALIWASTGNVETNTGPSPETHIKCPDCRELIKKDAKKCRFCGCSLIPQ